MPAAGQVPERAPAKRPAGAPGVGRETILLVEDEDTVRRFAKFALERHGYRVIEAASPDQALSLAADSGEPIALLLTDVVMPHLSGPELAERLKAMRPELPVLYMSGYPAGMVMQGAMLDSSVRLIPKPFTTSDLLAHIDDVLGRASGDARHPPA
jgi:DNA-binding NtrC family response regulator